MTLTGISIYILKDIHIYFFSLGRCYVAIISFLSAGAGTVCSVRHHSCSVLPDRGIKNHNFSTAVNSSCLNIAFLSYPSCLLVPSLFSFLKSPQPSLFHIFLCRSVLLFACHTDDGYFALMNQKIDSGFNEKI